MPPSAPNASAQPPRPALDFASGHDAFVLLRARRLHHRGLLPADEITSPASLPDPEVTAVIPTLNEAATIATVIAECRLHVAHVLVVDGGSSDATADLARAAGARVIRDSGQGKGAALRQAIAHVHTPIVVFVDADGSHDPIDIPLLVAPIKERRADQAHGSRLLGGSDELHGGWDEFFRLTGSALITCLINVRFGVRLSDSQNGFRAIRTEVFRSLPLRSRHTTIEMELVMSSLAHGYSLAEVPAHERPRAAGYSKISLARPGTWLSYGWTLLRGITQPRRLPSVPAVVRDASPLRADRAVHAA